MLNFFARIFRPLSETPVIVPVSGIEAEIHEIGMRDSDRGVFDPPVRPGLRQDAYLEGHALAEFYSSAW